MFPFFSQIYFPSAVLSLVTTGNDDDDDGSDFFFGCRGITVESPEEGDDETYEVESKENLDPGFDLIASAIAVVTNCGENL